jgi:hypothetical protein
MYDRVEIGKVYEVLGLKPFKKTNIHAGEKNHESLPIFLFRISNPKEWNMILL